MDQLQLRPLNVGEILDAAIKIFRRNGRTMLTIAAVVLAPLVLLELMLVVSAFSSPLLLDPDTVPDTEEVLTFLGGAVLLVVLSALAGLLVKAGAMKAVSDVYLGRVPDWRDSLGYAARQLGRLLVNGVVWVIGIGLGLLFCLVPGIWLWGMWAVAVPAIVVERQGAVGALTRSSDLVKGRFWPVLGILLLLWVARTIANYAVQTISTVLLFTGPGEDLTVNGVISAGLQFGVDLFVLPFTAAAIAVLYFDLRVRKEGFDLELLARQVGGGATFPQPGASPPAWTPPPPPTPEGPPPSGADPWATPPPSPPPPQQPGEGQPPPSE